MFLARGMATQEFEFALMLGDNIYPDGNKADVAAKFGRPYAELLKRGVKPDLLTDQTSAHDPVNGYLPQGWTVEQWDEKRVSAPKDVEKAARASMANHIRAMLGFHALGVPTVDYGNNLRQMALDAAR